MTEENTIVEAPRSADTLTTGTLEEAVANATAAQVPYEVGTHGLFVHRPEGFAIDRFDVREFEDTPRRVEQTQKIVGCDSLQRYLAPHQSDNTRAYLRDVYGRGREMLAGDTDLCTVIIDDNEDDNVPSARAHRAVLVLRPTAAARRWAKALSGQLNQEQFLNVVADGMSEIAEPDGAQLHDLISNLHAIRRAEVESIVRTGGEGTIQLKENVQLSAGNGNKVPFPESMEIVLTPFAAHGNVISVTVKIQPDARGDAVLFSLTAPGLDDALAALVSDVATEIKERTEISPYWTP
ncbi:MAG: DUF2303 family protein [Actinomycetota bacterium]